LASNLSILLPCRIPFKCIKPWINKKATKFVGFLSNRGDSFFASDRLMKISPVVLSSGKLKILVGLFFPRYELLSSWDFLFPTKTSERLYFLPNTTSFIRAKDTLGSVFFVLFVIVKLLSVIYFVNNTQIWMQFKESASIATKLYRDTAREKRSQRQRNAPDLRVIFCLLLCTLTSYPT